MKKIKFVLSAAALLLVLSCSNKESGKAETERPIYIGQTWILEAEDPLNASVPWSMTSSGISETVYMLDESGNLYSRFIKEVERIDDLKWKALMKEEAKFSDGETVNAKTLCGAMNEIMEKNKFSNATAGIITFMPLSDFEFEIKTERPAESIKSVFAEWSNVVFKRLENGKFVFTGPYIIEKIDAGNELVLEPNPYYPNAENRSKVIIKLFKDEAAMKLAYSAGELDMAFTVTPEVAKMLEAEKHIVKTVDAGYQYFGIVNTASNILSDINVRTALNFGLNREDYITALKGGRIPSGIFASYYKFAGNCSLKYDKQRAQKILDEAGWIMGSDGIREKAGKKLELKLVTYPSRPDLTVIMQIMASQMQELGIKPYTEIVDNIDGKAKSGEFDLILYAQHTAPTGDPSFFLNQFFRSEQAKNFSRYNSAKVDELLKEMGSVDFDKKINYAKDIQEIIFTDLPVLYLVDPQWHIALSDRLKNYKPYCGDYYIVNSELFVK
ncbi:ABC transporter substrate-binding protein [Treponema pedis]|uniref:Oligopeptide-binding protein oppA n=1 Tax=Treponema pedis str. T A4 TaxID=1291379 RepID=S5ZVY6_9SPIR|nr:ABC transporter substrate-binding protein [Treponema pedis]AGT44480.1 oligopeptide-binding protein oppA [Treponema pedis str. T A4]